MLRLRNTAKVATDEYVQNFAVGYCGIFSTSEQSQLHVCTRDQQTYFRLTTLKFSMVGSYTEDLQKKPTNWEMGACPDNTVLVVMCYGWFSLSGWQAHSSSRWRSLPVWARAADEGSWSAKTLSYISCRPAVTHTIAWVMQTAGQLVHLSVNLLAKSVSQSVQLLMFPGFPC